MPIVTIDTNNEHLYEPRSFEPAPKGVYICSITGKNGSWPLVVAMSKKNSSMVPVELRIEADADGSKTSHKGKTIFENCVLADENGKANTIGQQQLAHLAQCFGAMTQEEIRAAGGVDLDRFSPTQRGKVEISVRNEENLDGEKEPRNRVKRYLW